jgi:DNA polymerase I
MKVDIRSFIIAPPKKVLIVADYAGQEVRILAHITQDPTLLEAFAKNQDPHLAVANKFFDLGIPEECLCTLHPEYEEYRTKYKKERYDSKTINFSIAYGKTAYGFAADWNVSVAKAEKFIEDYFKRFPKIKDAINKCNRLTREQKAIRNLTGRIRRFDYIDNRAYRMAFNFCIQGAAADMMKKAAGDTYKLCQKYLDWDCKLIMSVHDELVYEIYKKYVDEALPIIKSTMENAVKLCIPMLVDIGYGDNYSQAKG